MMVKKISTSELRVGMYVHKLGRSWMDHPFVKSQFQVKDSNIIQKIASSGIREVLIDTSKGLENPLKSLWQKRALARRPCIGKPPA